MKHIPLLAITFFLTIQSVAQKSPCEKDSVYRQFDFWIGNWEVYDLANNKAGDSKISSVLNSCMIMEEWESSNKKNGINYSGKSLNTYNASTKQWQQSWVDNSGGSNNYLIGKFEKNKIEFLTAAFTLSKDTLAMRRLTLYKLSDQKVRQFGEISKDNGKTWLTEYDLDYRRKKGSGMSPEADIKTQYFLMDEHFKKNEMEKIANSYMDDARIVGTGEEIKGKEAIAAYWKQLDGKGITWEHQIQSIEVCNEMAVQTGISKLIYYQKGNKETVSDVRYTIIWKKDKEGIWKIALYHHTKL
ncbi:MAG: nuclear transport factor 2 family protein [Burkholderiales bacterium]|nr:nuclear transport factor 2 family protein [Bacteroidia bacterium]